MKIEDIILGYVCSNIPKDTQTEFKLSKAHIENNREGLKKHLLTEINQIFVYKDPDEAINTIDSTASLVSIPRINNFTIIGSHQTFSIQPRTKKFSELELATKNPNIPQEELKQVNDLLHSSWQEILNYVGPIQTSNHEQKLNSHSQKPRISDIPLPNQTIMKGFLGDNWKEELKPLLKEAFQAREEAISAAIKKHLKLAKDKARKGIQLIDAKLAELKFKTPPTDKNINDINNLIKGKKDLKAILDDSTEVTHHMVTNIYNCSKLTLWSSDNQYEKKKANIFALITIALITVALLSSGIPAIIATVLATSSGIKSGPFFWNKAHSKAIDPFGFKYSILRPSQGLNIIGPPTFKDFKDLGIKADVAFVRYDNELYWVNNIDQGVRRLFIRKDKDFKNFDKNFSSSAKERLMSPQEINNIHEATNEVPAVLVYNKLYALQDEAKHFNSKFFGEDYPEEDYPEEDYPENDSSSSPKQPF